MSRTSTPPLQAVAPAKINLYLHILGRRADGYHLIDSLVAFVDLHDRLSFRPAAEIRLAVTGPFAADIEPGEDNLVCRAARAFAAAGDSPPLAGVAVTLDKMIPVAAGLGGGSADAAAVLDRLGALWNMAIEAAPRARIALSLGADVPVCLFGRPAFVGGIGESVTAEPALPPISAVLVNPRIALGAGEVYAGVSRRWQNPAPPWPGAAADAAGLAALLAARGNDLTPAAMALAPVIGDVLAALSAQPDCLLARMSGSGPTCFGLFARHAAAETAAAALAAARPEWWVRPSRVLSDQAPPGEGNNAP